MKKLKPISIQPEAFFKKVGQLSFLLFIATLIVVPIYPKFPFIDLPGTSVSIRLEDFLVFALVLTWAIYKVRNFKKTTLDLRVLSIIVFLLAGLVSLLSAILVTNTVEPAVGLLHLLRRFEYLILLPVGFDLVSSIERKTMVVKALLIVTLYAFLFGLGQKYLAWPVITTQNAEYSQGLALTYMPGGHMISTFAGHYDLASFLVVVLPLWWVLALSPKKVLREIKVMFGGVIFDRILYFIAALGGLWLLTHAASRISIVSYLGVLVLAVFFVGRKWAIVPLVALSLLVTGFTGNIVSRYQGIIEVVVDRISDIASLNVYASEANQISSVQSPPVEDRSFAIRQNISWPRAINAFMKNPLLGTGYSSISLATDNGFLRTMGEVGLAGAFSFFALLLVSFLSLIKKAYQSPKHSFERIFAVCVAASFSGVLLNNVFIDIFEASKFAIFFWSLVGAAASTVKPSTHV